MDEFESLAKQMGLKVPEKPDATSPMAAVPPRGSRKSAYTQAELEDALRRAGFKDEALVGKMGAIGMAEAALDAQGRARMDSFNPGVGPGGRPTKERSAGPWQINTLAHPEYDKQRLLSDIDYNAKAAHDIFYKKKQGLKAWGAYTDGRYRKFYKGKPVSATSSSQQVDTSLRPDDQALFDEMYGQFVASADVPSSVPSPTMPKPVAPIGSTPFVETGITDASPVATPVSDELKKTVSEGLQSLKVRQGYTGSSDIGQPAMPYSMMIPNGQPETPESKATSAKYDEWRTAAGLDDTPETRKEYNDVVVPTINAQSQEASDLYNKDVDAYNRSLPQVTTRRGAVPQQPQTAQRAASQSGDSFKTRFAFSGDAIKDKDEFASRAANALGFDFDVVRQYITEKGLSSGQKDSTRWKGRESNFVLDAEDIATIRAMQGQYEKANRRQETQKATAENQINEHINAGEIASVAQLLAAKDVGIKEIKGRPIDDLIQEERAAFQRFKDELRNDPNEYNRILQSEDARRRLLAGESADQIVADRWAAANQIQIDRVLREIEDKKLKGFADREAEQKRISQTYGTLSDSTRPMARPSEFALNFFREFAKLPGQAANLIGMGADAMSPAGIDPKINPFVQFGEAWKSRIDEAKNKDLRDEMVVGDFAQALAQLAQQTITIPFTGGASVLLPLGQAAESQYLDAAKGKATRNQRIWAATVGGLAAVPDAWLKFNFLKTLAPAARLNFFDNFVKNLATGLASQMSKNEARQATMAFVTELVAKAPVGYFTEKYQERTEDIINKAWASKAPGGLAYAPDKTWSEIITPTEREMQGYEAAGLVGLLGAGGGVAAERIQQLSDVELANSESVIQEAFGNKLTQDQLAELLNLVNQERQRRDATAQPEPPSDKTVVADKKGNTFTVLEDQGEKLKVQDEKGVISVRNADRLTPIDEKSKVQEPPAPVVEGEDVSTTKVEGKNEAPVEAKPEPSIRYHEKMPQGLPREAPLTGQKGFEIVGKGETKGAGRTVTVNEQEITLTPEQESRWVEEVEKPLAKAKEYVARAKKSKNRVQIEEASSHYKGEAMRVAAIKREITGLLTTREKKAKQTRDASNFIGKEVSVGGRNAKVIGNPFGRVKVEFADGSTQTVDANKVEPLAAKSGIQKYPLASRDEWYGEANYETAGGRMVEMSPDEYLSQVRPLVIDEESRENIDLLKQHIVDGKTLDPLKIFSDGKEDGRHRAIAAKELGITAVPVIRFDAPAPKKSAKQRLAEKGKPKALSAEQTERLIAKSPIPSPDEFIRDVVNQYLPSIVSPGKQEFTPQEFAAKLVDRFDVSTPQNRLAYSALMNADPSIRISRSEQGVYVRGRFKGNEPIANISKPASPAREVEKATKESARQKLAKKAQAPQEVYRTRLDKSQAKAARNKSVAKKMREKGYEYEMTGPGVVKVTKYPESPGEFELDLANSEAERKASSQRGKPVANPKTQSLSTYLLRRGGFQPNSVIDLEAIKKSKLGKFFISSNGQDVEDAFRDAVEAGYFPGLMGQRAGQYDMSVHEFVNAVADDADGIRKIYTSETIEEISDDIDQQFREYEEAQQASEAKMRVYENQKAEALNRAIDLFEKDSQFRDLLIKIDAENLFNEDVISGEPGNDETRQLQEYFEGIGISTGFTRDILAEIRNRTSRERGDAAGSRTSDIEGEPRPADEKRQAAGEVDYFKGDQIEYTGKIDDDGLLEFVYLEGHKKGEKGFKISDEARDANTQKKQDDYRQQQDEFAKLNKPKEGSSAAIVRKVLSGLSNIGGIEHNAKFGTVTERLEGLATATVANVGGKWYGFMEKPKYYGVTNFYANSKFADVVSTKQGIAEYNKKNKDKIHEFDNIEDLIKFVESLSEKRATKTDQPKTEVSKPKPATAFDQVDLFGNKTTPKTEQRAMFDMGEAVSASGIEGTINDLRSKSGNEAIVKDAEDAFEFFNKAQKSRATVADMLKQQRIEGGTVADILSDRAIEFLKAMDAGKFDTAVKEAQSDPLQMSAAEGDRRTELLNQLRDERSYVKRQKIREELFGGKDNEYRSVTEGARADAYEPSDIESLQMAAEGEQTETIQKGSLVTYADPTGMGHRARKAFRVTSDPKTIDGNTFAMIREVTRGGVYHPSINNRNHTALLKNFITIDPETFFNKDADRTLFPESSLQMGASDSALSRFKDVQYAHTQTLLEGAKSEIKEVDGQTILELNEEAAELARRTQAEMQQKAVTPFYGSTYTAPMLRKLASTANKVAAEYIELGYTPAQVKSFRTLAANFIELANQAHGVAYVFDFALPHETHHKLVLDALNGKPFPKEVLKSLEALDIWTANPTITTPDGVSKPFKSAYPRLSKQAKAFEIAAMLETGEIVHPDKNKFLDLFARGILEVTTELDPVKFARIIDYASQTSDTGRDQAESADTEADGSLDEPSPPKGEGDGQRSEAAPGTREGTADDIREKATRQITDTDRLFKNRQFAVTLREAGYTGTPDVPYIPDTEKQWMDEAQRLLSLGDAQAEKVFWDESTSRQQRTVLGIALVDRLGAMGDVKKMQDVATELVKHVGTAAQALRASQLAAKYDFATGMMLVTKAAERAGKPLTDKQLDQTRDKLLEIAKLTEEKAELEFYAEELKDGIAERDAQIADLEEALNEANEQKTIDDKTRKKLERQLAYWKDQRQKTRVFGARKIKEIEAKLPDLERILKDAFDGLQMVAWHGSPHRFEKFDISKIGTGEGNQAYGYGLYFAGKEAVADHYKKVLAPQDDKLDVIDADGNVLLTTSYDTEAWNLARETPGATVVPSASNKPRGAKYRVDLKPAEDEYLLWDKPLSEQSEKVKKALDSLLDDTERKRRASWKQPAWGLNPGDDPNAKYEEIVSGAATYNGLAADLKNPKAASEMMRNAGIRGIKYLDGSSRGRGEGNYNYVIFDDQDVEILESFQMSADDKVHDAMVEIAVYDILKGKSPKDTIKHLQDLTGLEEAELREIHLEAYESTKGTKPDLTKDARKKIETRRAHAKYAKETRGAEQRVRERPSIYDREVMAHGRANDYSDADILGAMMFPKIRSGDVIAQWKKINPNADYQKAYTLQNEAKRNIKKRQLEAKAEKEGFGEDLRGIENLIRHNAIASRHAKQGFDAHARKLEKGWGEFALDTAVEGVSLGKGLSAWGEISYLLRQGFVPLITDTWAAIKGDWQGVGHGLQSDNKMWQFLADKAGYENVAQYLADHNINTFIERIRQHPRFLEAQNSGVRFSQIGDFNIADDHFSTKLLQGVPLYKRAEYAYTLPGDLQRLYMFDTWATLLDQNAQLTDEQRRKALKYAAETVNAFTGKGDVARILERGGTIAKLLNLGWFSPQLLFSRFQSLNRLSLGFATAPKGLKWQMAKKGMRFYGLIALIGYLVGMGLDPDDDEFGMINISKDSWLNKANPDAKDLHINFLAGMDMPFQLYYRTAAGIVKSLIKGDSGYVGDALKQNVREFGVSKYGEPRFLRGKLSPGMSLTVDAATGWDYLGRPFTWWGGITSRTVPLAWQQTYDALLYDRYKESLREPRTFEYAKQKLTEREKKEVNALMMMIGTFTGIGVTQYPKENWSKAMQKAATLSPVVSKKDAETLRQEGGLRNLLKMKLELLQKRENTRKVDVEIQRWMALHPALKAQFNKINGQAGSSTGLFSYYVKDLTLPQLERVREIATDADEIKILDQMLIKRRRAGR